MDQREMDDLVAQLTAPPPEIASPYAAGFDCGQHGPNTRNCHFGWFRSAEWTREWERGNREGKAEVSHAGSRL